MLNILGRFEVLRRIYGHEAVVHLDHPVLNVEVTSSNWLALLFDYAAAVVGVAEKIEADWPHHPAPVRPVVDLASGVVRHTTCTGNTKMTVTRDEIQFETTSPPDARTPMVDFLVSHAPDPKTGILFLSPAECHMAGLSTPEGVRTGFCRGEWASMSYPGGDILVTPDVWYRDFDWEVSDDEWMSGAPDAIRESVRAALALAKGWSSFLSTPRFV